MAEKPTVAMGTYEEMLRAMTVRAEIAEAALAKLRAELRALIVAWWSLDKMAPEWGMAASELQDKLINSESPK